ncbi:MAG: oligosaccharide flippase family protein [bacterium]
MNIQKDIIKILNNSKISSISFVLFANVFNNIIAFFVNIWLARKFGPEEYGIFSLTVSVMMTVYLIVNFGLNLTTIRFFNLYLNEIKKQSLLLKTLLILRFVILLVLSIGALPLAFVLTRILNINDLHSNFLALAIITGGIFGLWLYVQNYMQVYQRFKKLANHITLYAFFRFTFFALLLFIAKKHLNFITVFSSLYTLPLVLIICVGIIPAINHLFRSGFPSINNLKTYISRILGYSKWVALSSICFSLIYRFIQFILSSRSSKYELGLLSAGFLFTITFSTLNMAMRTVFFPYVSAFEHIDDIKKHMRRIKKTFPYFLILVIPIGAILIWIQLAFLGEEYANALPVFLITAAALALTMYMGLISMLLHTLMLPKIDAYTNVVRFVLAGIMIYALAPRFGAIGGAISYAIPLILGEIFMVYYVYKKIYKQK